MMLLLFQYSHIDDADVDVSVFIIYVLIMQMMLFHYLHTNDADDVVSIFTY